MSENQPSDDPKPKRPQGKTPTEVRAEITQLYQHTHNGTELANALKAKHYTLEKSTRNVIVIIDSQGGEHNLFRQIVAPKEEIKQKLADLNPANLPLKKSREREAVIKCHVTSAEQAEIKKRANQAELSVSGYLRTLIFDKKTPPSKASRRPSIDKETLVSLRYELRKIGGELSQLANAPQQNQDVDHNAFSKLFVAHENVLNAIMTALNK